MNCFCPYLPDLYNFSTQGGGHFSLAEGVFSILFLCVAAELYCFWTILNYSNYRCRFGKSEENGHSAGLMICRVASPGSSSRTITIILEATVVGVLRDIYDKRGKGYKNANNQLLNTDDRKRIHYDPC